jgi:formate hydrogenlyase subunit 3/multisubunit Na+/H+ antiporter MnhD subunit
MITPEQAVLAAILICLGGAVLVLPLSRNKNSAGWFAFFVTVASAILILLAVGEVLTSGPSPHAATFWAMPEIGFALCIHVDGLTSMFLLLAAVIAVPTSFYSIVYMRHYPDYGVARYYPHFLAFLAAMYGLLSTTDMMWFFFIFWQMMTLPGYALIRFENRKPENIRAANKFLIMMQIACAATMIGAELLAVTGAAARGGASLKCDFDTVSGNLPLLLATRPGTTALAFALFLVGFGIKMGMWPFGQFWLPDAHPAAPSPVSAMLSGVMIKTGVYGLMRYFLWLVPVEAQSDYPMARWGLIVAVLGTVTLFTGTMQALKQEQTKRLLAFHSIGQIGYILLGTGACMVLLSSTRPDAAALATIAFFGALFHVLNHGLFKGLLFLNAGSLLHATGTQDLNKMGGLMKFMPLTAITALIASFSISGVPLFNGYVSKWSICVAALLGSGSARYLAVCAVIAILTSALTLASFIKFFGTSFLSRTSALVTERAARNGRLEVGWIMQIPQVFLASLCVLLGLVPAIAFRLMQHALDASRQGFGAALSKSAPMVSGPLTGLEGFDAAARFAPLALAALLGLLFLVAYGISRIGGAPRRAAVPWLCGYVPEQDCHRYVAHNFYGEIKRYFRWLGGMPHPQPGKQKVLKGN